MPVPVLRRLFRVLLRLLLGLGAAALVLVGWRIVVLATASTPRHAEVVQQVFRADPLPVFTPQHLQLVRALQVWWLPVESGAPGVDPGQPLRGETPAVQRAQQLLATDGKRPYGDRSYYTIDMAEILGRPFAVDGRAGPSWTRFGWPP
jgi:hypothetical protein